MNEHNKVAVVTGAARGIGLAVARWFLDHGYRVGLIDIDAVTLAVAVPTLDAADRVEAVVADVSQPAQVDAAITKIVARFGRIDSLVNNAAAVFKPILETTFDEWRTVMATNLDGPFICTQRCAPVMLATAGGGSVVNIASIFRPACKHRQVAYGTSKAALIHLTKQQAAELGDRWDRVDA